MTAGDISIVSRTGTDTSIFHGDSRLSLLLLGRYLASTAPEPHQGYHIFFFPQVLGDHGVNKNQYLGEARWETPQ